MKKFLFAVGIAGVMASCTTQQAKDEEAVLGLTTAKEIHEFREWKAEKEAAEMEAAALEASKPVQTVVYKVKEVPVYTNNAPAATASQASVPAATASKPKGWSRAAKGAVIGAGAGAAAGAVINKRNRGAGAAVGGVLGGGIGYVLGRSQDIKKGRY